MYKTKIPLTCIPERDEDDASQKWVSKNKHDVLKAKYKCLKKLFEVYDANMIGTASEQISIATELNSNKKSCTDVSAGTSNDTICCKNAKSDKRIEESINRIKEIKKVESNYTKASLTKIKSVEIIEENESVQEINQIDFVNNLYNNNRKLTKFQLFIHRLFGIKNRQNNHGHIIAASDNNIVDKRYKRRGLKLRRRRQRKSQSESILQDLKRPDILKYVQSVQMNCLLDTTLRYCPIAGCKSVFYGIINYNDHLNLSHFTEKTFYCHYCHEGFETASAKICHENDHLGLSKLNLDTPYKGDSKVEIKDELSQVKLKKIISFFDKIVDKHKVTNKTTKNMSELNVNDTETEINIDRNTKLHKSNTTCNKYLTYNEVPVKFNVLKCKLCKETFDNNRQLNLHVQSEHSVNNKFTKFHSCAGILTANSKEKTYDITENGTINLEPIEDDFSDQISNRTSSTFTDISKGRLNFKSSINKVECTKSGKDTSNSNNKKIAYHWEPGTKIIYV